MHAGLKKVEKDIERRVKQGQSISDKRKAKIQADRKLKFYMKFHKP